MMEAVIVNYTQTDIDNAICGLNAYYVKLTDKLTKKWLYSVPCVDIVLLKELFLYRWAIDGQIDYNLLTLEELNYLVQKIKTYKC